MSESAFTAAAWAPWVDFGGLDAGTSTSDDERDWLSRRDALATAWVLARAKADQAGVVLRVPSHARDYRDGPFHVLTTHGAVVTNRGRHVGARGATLVPNGYEEEVAGGMQCATRTGIVVTEHPAFPLDGWAMAVGALNLRTLRTEPDARTDDQREHIDHLISMLYNGWTSTFGRRAAERLLPVLAESGTTWSVFVGSMLATAPSRMDMDRMRKLAPPSWRTDIAAIHDRCMRRW